MWMNVVPGRTYAASIAHNACTPVKLTIEWKARQIADGLDVTGSSFCPGPSNRAALADVKLEGE